MADGSINPEFKQILGGIGYLLFGFPILISKSYQPLADATPVSKSAEKPQVNNEFVGKSLDGEEYLSEFEKILTSLGYPKYNLAYVSSESSVKKKEVYVDEFKAIQKSYK